MLLVYALITAAFTVLAFMRLRWAFFIYVFLFASYPKLLAVGVWEEGFALSLQFLLAIALMGVWVTLWLMGDHRAKRGIDVVSRYPFLWAPILGLFVYKVLGSVALGEYGVGTFSALVNEFIISVWAVLITAVCVRTQRDVVTLLGVIALSLVVNEVWVLLEMAKGAPLLKDLVNISYRVEGRFSLDGRFLDTGYRAMGVFSNPLQLAAFACIALPPALFLVKNSSGVLRYKYIVPVIMAPVAVYFTRSRFGLILLMIILAIYLSSYVVSKAKLGRVLRACVLMLGLVVLGGSSYLMVNYANKITRASEFELSDDRSVQSRIAQYELSSQLLSEGPVRLLMGYGAQRNLTVELDRLDTLDNYYIRTALEAGIFGLLLLVMTYVGLYRLTKRILKMGGMARSVAVTVRFMTLALMISMNFLSYPYIYMYLYLCVAIAMSVAYAIDGPRPRRLWSQFPSLPRQPASPAFGVG
jgi:O-antigen ligase